jgi:hypothetical protein
MDAPVTDDFEIVADWEQLNDGSPEERACFASISIRNGNRFLTEGQDYYVKRIRHAPLLSGYHLAEWMAWNWWRQRWEPRSRASDWAFAHKMATIGEGYVWPNITIFSDGERTTLIANATQERPNTKFRYLGTGATVIGAHTLENVVAQFIGQVQGQLRAEGIKETNLDRIWNAVSRERQDIEAAKIRRLEALLGYDPDESNPSELNRLLDDLPRLGDRAAAELAAEKAQSGELLTAGTLKEISQKLGFDASPRDVISLAPGTGLPRPSEVQAWHLGATAARAVREQHHPADGPISDRRLSEMAGVDPQVLARQHVGSKISFALDEGATIGRVALRSKWDTGRRFELARILAERIVLPGPGPLFPATHAYTYRQKMQRSFAAELLSPFEAIDEMLGGDYSTENQQEAAEYFQVSEMTIRTSLVNHRRLEREELGEEFDYALA